MAERKAFITGITGQDGSYLSEYLLSLGYEVGGLVRMNADMTFKNISHLVDTGQVKLFYGDLAHHPESIVEALSKFKPNEIYNLAAMSHPGLSVRQEIDTLRATGESAIRVFNAARNIVPEARIYQASTSELFGETNQSPQNENTPMDPATPYALAKFVAHSRAGQMNRDEKNPTWIARGILNNHESPRRGDRFVTQKVAIAVAAISLNKKNGIPLDEEGLPIVRDGKLTLGDLDAQRDWGSAKDYVRYMHQMLHLDKPEVIVIGTGKTRTVRELCEAAFRYKGLDYCDFVVTDPRYVPPIRTGPLCADITKAKKILGFEAKKLMKFEDVIAEMVEAQIQRLM